MKVLTWLAIVALMAAIIMAVSGLGCCTWQGLADTGIMGAGWNDKEDAR